MRSVRTLCFVLAGAAFVACSIVACESAEPEAEPTLTREQLLDPQACASCHVSHFREWSGSMHAYAAEDPIFIAMNARLQRENPETKDFCVKCHAPLAVSEGLTTDGLNLADVPKHLRGVTCYFCHNVVDVEGTHNNPLKLANDVTMRGPFESTVRNGVHRTAYSSLIDGRRTESAHMCGACHDIVTLQNAHIERTFAEWRGSVFATETDPGAPASPTGNTCNACHMQSRREAPVTLAIPNLPNRKLHLHTFAGIDVALTPFPEMDAQRQEIQEKLDGESLQSALCVADVTGNSSQITAVLHALTGHSFPSGAVSDRRVWLEIVAYRGEEVVYESGRVGAEVPVATRSLADDPDLLILRDCHFDANGKETHLFGQTATFESRLLEANTTFVATDPEYYRVNRSRRYPYEASRVIAGPPDRVTMRVLFRPMGLEVVDDLVASGDLAPEIRAKIPTFQVGPTTTWTREDAERQGLGYVESASRLNFKCVTATNAKTIVTADKTEIPRSETCR